MTIVRHIDDLFSTGYYMAFSALGLAGDPPREDRRIIDVYHYHSVDGFNRLVSVQTPHFPLASVRRFSEDDDLTFEMTVDETLLNVTERRQTGFAKFQTLLEHIKKLVVARLWDSFARVIHDVSFEEDPVFSRRTTAEERSTADTEDEYVLRLTFPEGVLFFDEERNELRRSDAFDKIKKGAVITAIMQLQPVIVERTSSDASDAFKAKLAWTVVQVRVDDSPISSATIIQAAFRGWRVRHRFRYDPHNRLGRHIISRMFEKGGDPP